PRVDGPQDPGDPVGFVGRPEDDGVHGLERAPEPAEGIGLESAVVGDAGRNLGMGQLHEEGPAAAEQQDALPAYPAYDGIIRKQSRHRTSGYRRALTGYAIEAMGALGLLLVPLALTVVVVLLIATAWLEESVLS